MKQNIKCIFYSKIFVVHYLNNLLVLVKGREFWHAAVLGFAKSQAWLDNWTMITKLLLKNLEENTKILDIGFTIFSGH